MSLWAEFFATRDGRRLGVFFIGERKGAIMATLSTPISEWEEWPQTVEEEDHDAEKASVRLVRKYGGSSEDYEPFAPVGLPTRPLLARFPTREGAETD